jgi:hypothetical protein
MAGMSVGFSSRVYRRHRDRKQLRGNFDAITFGSLKIDNGFELGRLQDHITLATVERR